MLASHENLAMLRIAVAQLNPIMGDIAGNLTKARAARAEAARMKADLILFTELFISGYPPEDLVLKPSFLAACEKAVRALDVMYLSKMSEALENSHSQSYDPKMDIKTYLT